MVYAKQTWLNGVEGGTPLGASRLNHIEAGIETASTDVDAVSSDLGVVQELVNTGRLSGPVLAAASDAQTADDLENGPLSQGVLTATIGRQVAPPKLTLIAPGDSIGRQNFYESGTLKGWAASGYLTWLNAWLGDRVEIVNPRGSAVAGNTTAQILARLAADVTPYAAGVAVVMAGTNDVDNGVALGTITANLEDIYDALRAAGSLVVACTILPRNVTGDSDADRQKLVQVNTWIKDYCASARGVVVADTHAALVDPRTGRALGGESVASQWFADGIHPNPDGAHAVASVLYKVLDPILPRHNGLTESNIDPDNLLTNGRFTNVPGYLALPGASGSYASAPDDTDLPRGTFSVAVWAALDDWTPTAREVLAAQYLTTGNQMSFHFGINTTGLPQLSIDRYGDNTVATYGIGASSPGFTDGAVGCIIATRDVTAGTIQFATSAVAASDAVADLAGLSTSALGAAITGKGAWSTFDASTDVEVGSRQGGTVDPLKGKVYRVMIFDATGATVRDINFTAYAGEATIAEVVGGHTVTVHPSGWSTGDSWSITNGTGNAATVSKVDRTDGVYGQWQQVAVTANTTPGNTTDLTWTLTGWAVGDILEAEVEIEVGADWVAGSGGAQALFPFLAIQCLDGAAATTLKLQNPVALGSPTSLTPLIPAGESGPFRSVLRTPAAAIPVGTTSVKVLLRHGIGATGTARWDRCRVRKVSAAT